MAKKFVINNNRLVIGNVECHFELSKDNSTTIGGGYWHIDEDKKRLYLYSSSTDYGSIEPDDLDKCDIHFRWREYDIWFSSFDSLKEVLTIADLDGEDSFYVIKKEEE